MAIEDSKLGTELDPNNRFNGIKMELQKLGFEVASESPESIKLVFKVKLKQNIGLSIEVSRTEKGALVINFENGDPTFYDTKNNQTHQIVGFKGTVKVDDQNQNDVVRVITERLESSRYIKEEIGISGGVDEVLTLADLIKKSTDRDNSTKSGPERIAEAIDNIKNRILGKN